VLVLPMGWVGDLRLLFAFCRQQFAELPVELCSFAVLRSAASRAAHQGAVLHPAYAQVRAGAPLLAVRLHQSRTHRTRRTVETSRRSDSGRAAPVATPRVPPVARCAGG